MKRVELDAFLRRTDIDANDVAALLAKLYGH